MSVKLAALGLRGRNIAFQAYLMRLESKGELGTFENFKQWINSLSVEDFLSLVEKIGALTKSVANGGNAMIPPMRFATVIIEDDVMATAKPKFKPGGVVVNTNKDKSSLFYKGEIIVEYGGGWLIDAGNGEVVSATAENITLFDAKIERAAVLIDEAIYGEGRDFNGWSNKHKASRYCAALAAIESYKKD